MQLLLLLRLRRQRRCCCLILRSLTSSQEPCSLTPMMTLDEEKQEEEEAEWNQMIRWRRSQRLQSMPGKQGCWLQQLVLLRLCCCYCLEVLDEVQQERRVMRITLADQRPHPHDHQRHRLPARVSLLPSSVAEQLHWPHCHCCCCHRCCCCCRWLGQAT